MNGKRPSYKLLPTCYKLPCEKLLFLCLFLVPVLPLLAQRDNQHVIDSLLAEAGRHPADDTVKCNLYLAIGNTYRQTDTKASVEWLQKSVSLAQKLNFYRGLQYASNGLGIALYTLGKPDEAIESFERYKTACIINKDSVSLAWAYNNIGNIYIDKTQYPKTLAYYDSALKVRTLLNDSMSIAQSYINYGFVYKDLGDYTQALLHLYQAARYLERSGNIESLAFCYNFIGSVYVLRKNYTYSNHFYAKALELYRKVNDRSSEAIAIGVMGTNYYKLGQKEKGKQMILEALEIHTRLNDVRQLGHVASDLSEIYINEEKYDSAELLADRSIRYFRQAGITRQLGALYLKLSKAQEKNGKLKEAIASASEAYEHTRSSGERASLAGITEMLSSFYVKAGNFEKAHRFLLISSQLKDSLKNESTEAAIAQMQVKYETEKKDIEILNQGLEIRKKRAQLLLAVFSIVAVIIIGILLYLRYRLRQKALLNELLLEEQNARNKAIIEAEEKERVRIARELHDGIGQQLSAAKMNLSAFEEKVDTEHRDNYQAVIRLVDDAVKEVRSVSHNMMPNALIKQGLSSAVRDFINKMQPATGLKISLEIIGMNERLNSNIEIVLYRVLQECVNNIIKHARASTVNIQMVKHGQILSVMVEDNGRGFDSSRVNHFEGIGLKNIISRVQFLNGTVDFDSTIGHGTTVVITIPLT